MTSPVEMKQVSRIRFETRLDETLGYWKRRITSGMRLHVPDEMLNSFYLAVLQHILVSEERDLKTGYMMCPCGTYDYNMFANETDIQVRLLDMRGLHQDAWRCLRPIVELQGSKPFPGRFSETSAALPLSSLATAISLPGFHSMGLSAATVNEFHFTGY